MPDSGIMPDVTFGHWGFDAHAAGTAYGPRLHADFDLILILDGEVVWECDGVRHPAPAGTLILARPGMRDTLHWDRQRISRNFYLHFTPQRDLGLGAPQRWPTTRLLPEGDILRPLLHHLAWLLESQPSHWQVLADSALLHVLRCYVGGQVATVGSSQARLSPIVEAVIAFTARRWDDRPLRACGLDELARAAQVSREHLCRIFQREIGCSPVEALRFVRLERAATLLARFGVPIAEVAQLAGFADQFHFSRRFRSAYGCSPTAFRERIRRGQPWPIVGPAGVRALSRRLWEELRTKR